jgi:hypothetical protein
VNNLVAPVRAFNYFIAFNGGKEEKITGNCELSLDPEVAILFGREIGQSNGVFYLLVMNLQG